MTAVAPFSLSPISALLALVAVLCSTPAAQANAKDCGWLEAQFAALQPAGSKGNARWADAANRQRTALAAARAQSERLTCRSAAQSQACGVLLPTIGKMKAHLKTLEAKAGTGANQNGKRRIQGLLQKNGCRGGASATKEVVARKTLVDHLFGPNTSAGATDEARTRPVSVQTPDGAGRPVGGKRTEPRRKLGKRKPKHSGISAPTGRAAGPTYRTLCVRPCDGYFFPISFSTTTGRFSADQAACEAQCPDMDAELYVHSMPTEDVEAMVSVAGTPYRDLKTAFLYKLQGVSNTKSCGCRFAAEPSAPLMAERPADEASGNNRRQPVPTPTPRPDPAAEATVMLASAPSTVTIAEAPAKPRIRVVGPNFFPDR